MMCLQKTATLEKQKQSVPSVSRNNTKKKERECCCLLLLLLLLLLSNAQSAVVVVALLKIREKRCVISRGRKRPLFEWVVKKTFYYCEASLSFGLLNTKRRRRRWKKYARKKKDLKKKKKKKKSHRTFDSPPPPPPHTHTRKRTRAREGGGGGGERTTLGRRGLSSSKGWFFGRSNGERKKPPSPKESLNTLRVQIRLKNFEKKIASKRERERERERERHHHGRAESSRDDVARRSGVRRNAVARAAEMHRGVRGQPGETGRAGNEFSAFGTIDVREKAGEEDVLASKDGEKKEETTTTTAGADANEPPKPDQYDFVSRDVSFSTPRGKFDVYKMKNASSLLLCSCNPKRRRVYC